MEVLSRVRRLVITLSLIAASLQSAGIVSATATDDPAAGAGNSPESQSQTQEPPATGALESASDAAVATGTTPAAAFTISSNLPADQWISPDFALEIRVEPSPTAEQGTVGIKLGEADATSLFAPIASGLRYDSSLLPLPAGQSEAVISLVGADGTWTEIGRVTLRVLKAFAGTEWESAELRPTIAVGVQSQLASETVPDPGAGSREHFADWTFRSDLASELRRDDFAASGQMSVQGTGRNTDALRAFQLGDEAPQVDLASYSMGLQKWDSTLTVGSFFYGTSRQLVNGFASRGAMLQIPISTVADVAFAAGNTQSIVGWTNFSGLERARNQIYSGTVGLNHTFEEWGTVRVEASVLDGEGRPESNFNQASVTDAEQSLGGSLRLVVTDPSSRFRLDGAFTRSSFDNPDDPLLSQGLSLVPVRRSVRNAHYVDVALDLLRDVQVTDERTLGLTLAYQNERVEPLFRSLGAATLADLEQHLASIQGTLGDISLSLSGTLSEDNLARVRSLLTTKTRQAAANFSMPTASWLGTAGALEPWWPILDYNAIWVHQYGIGLPPDGGFNPAQVPDQISTVHGPGLRWQAETWTFGYQLGLSDQNNRQKGRERADLVNDIHTVAASMTPIPTFTFGVDLTLERARNREQDRTDFTRRFGVSSSVRPFEETTVSATGSVTYGEDQRDTASSRNHDFTLEVSQGYQVVTNVRSLFFARYAQIYGAQRDDLFQFDQHARAWAFTLGTSVALF